MKGEFIMGQIQNVPGPSQAAFNTLNDHIGTLLKVRASHSFSNPEAISANSTKAFSSNITAVSDDICIVRTSSDKMCQCTPFVNSSGKWCMTITAINEITLQSCNLVFQVLNVYTTT